MKIFSRNKWFGKYPSCEFLNIALRQLLDSPKVDNRAIENICYAICKANGYFYYDVTKEITEKGIFNFGDYKNIRK